MLHSCVQAQKKKGEKVKLEGNKSFKKGLSQKNPALIARVECGVAGEFAAAIALYEEAAAADPTNQGINSMRMINALTSVSGAQLNLAACYLKPACLDAVKALLAANRFLHITSDR